MGYASRTPFRIIEPDIEASSLGIYRTQAAHVTRRIGDRPFDAVTFLDIKSLAGKLRKDGLSFSTAYGVLRRLHAAYDLVLEQMPGGRNPVDFKRLKLRRPKGEAQDDEGEALSPEQLRALLAAGDDVEARGGDYRYGVAWWLGALLGLRRGEIAAVRWQDVDWKAHMLRVRNNWAPAQGGGYTLRPGTKNGQSFTVPLGPRLVARLRAQWELHQQDRRRATWKERGFILCHENGDPLDNATGINSRLTTLCRKAGLPPCNPHKLRHTCATLISEAGYSEAVIAAVLNHISTPTVTRRYTHATDEAVRAAVEAVEARVLGAPAVAAREAK